LKYNNDTDYLRHVRWKCRRGMLELDLVLESFVDKHFSTLSSQDQAVFERLLEAEDTQLQLWFTSQQTPQDKQLAAMIEYINRVYRSD